MKKVIFLLLLIVNISCATNYHPHGYDHLKLSNWNKIKVNDSKKDVIDILGRPTLQSALDDNSWYYITYQMSKDNIFNKKYNIEFLNVKFDKNDKVIEIKKNTK